MVVFSSTKINNSFKTELILFSSRFMRTEGINQQYGFDILMPVTRLMDHVSNSKNKKFSFLLIYLSDFRMSNTNPTL
jgi:hypothetical protein